MSEMVVRRDGAGREQAWTVWGEEGDVVARLSAGGATVRQVTPLKLEEAAIALLGMRENQHRLARQMRAPSVAGEGR